MKRIPQMEPWFGPEETRAVTAYMESGGWITEFKKTEEFEKEIARYTGATHCVATTSGTVALLLALLAVELRADDEVIVPDYTMIASANAIKLAGGTPILVDIAADNFCIDLRAAERAVTRRTRAMMVVSINGRSPDMSSAAELCRRHGLILVEDAAQSLGSRHQSRHLGTFGDLGCFSFSTPKVITTGQGGAVVTNNPDLAARMRLIKDFGRTRPGVDQHGVLGYNFKFTDVQAVIGLEQMKKLDWRVRRKKAIYERYSSQLDAARGIRLAPTDLAQTSPWFIDVLSDCRDELAAFLRENGIGTRPFYPAIHTQPPYGSVEGSFPVSVMISATGLWLPSSSFLTDEDIDYICDRIRSFRCGVASGTQTDGGAGTR